MSIPTAPASNAPAPVGLRPWQRTDTVRAAGLLAVIAALHVVAWGVLVLLVLPRHYALGSQVFGVGLAVTAYTLGTRHAFDADHIAAIDNTTRKLMADGTRPLSVGFWFALGHSTLVVALASLIAAGTRLATTLMDRTSTAHQVLGVVGVSLSGTFLYLIGLLNLVAFVAIARVFRRMRSGDLDEQALEASLQARGLIARALGPVMRSVRRPGQMYAVGILFGLGFDTASEVTLLVLAGSSAAGGLPWYAVLCLPLLFAAGMSLFDTLDGTFMTVAYHWAFTSPVRKVYYNLTITGLSVAVALGIGTIELVTVLHDKLHLSDAVTGSIAGLRLENIGYLVVGLFVLVWTAAIGYWHLAQVEQRWTPAPCPG